ncbi:MAG: transcription termination/antitermination NusG family protein [Hyphomicrobiales bacterium]
MKGSSVNHWYVIRTNPNCEYRAKDDLEAMGFRVFFPTFNKELKHHRKRVWIKRTFPLFNRYMFIEMPGERADWFKVRQANGVECILGVNGQPIPVPSIQIEQYIREFENGVYDELRSRAPKLAVGERIRIADGPLSGFYGMVTKADSKKKIRIMVDLFAAFNEIELLIVNVEKVV